MVMTTIPGVVVPSDYVRDDKITLNVSPEATQNLVLKNNAISFDARFKGIALAISVPMEAIMAIFAKENGQGMTFDVSPPPEPPPGDEATADNQGKSVTARPTLKVVK